MQLLTRSFWVETSLTFLVAFVATLVLGLTPIVDTATNVDAFVAGVIALGRSCVIAGLAAVSPRFVKFADKEPEAKPE